MIHYIREHCNEDRSTKIQNITDRLQEGRRLIEKRVRKKEIIVLASDKGKEVVVVTPEIYREMGLEHTAGDLPIDWRDLQVIQRDLCGHARSICRIFKVGESWGGHNHGRCFDNVSSMAADAPVMRVIPKTHKEPREDGVPRSRPRLMPKQRRPSLPRKYSTS